MKDTYETKNAENALETYEWDDVWFDHAEDSSLPRALILGDSISRGCRHVLVKKTIDFLHADNYASSKALDNAAFKPMLETVFSQEKNLKVVSFNNGLHGWHLQDAAYKAEYEKMVCLLEKLCAKSGAKLVITLTTPLRNSENLSEFDARNERVIARNEIAKEICKKHGLVLNDFYTPMLDKEELYMPDGVHFKEQGYDILSSQMKNVIQSLL